MSIQTTREWQRKHKDKLKEYMDKYRTTEKYRATKRLADARFRKTEKSQAYQKKYQKAYRLAYKKINH